MLDNNEYRPSKKVAFKVKTVPIQTVIINNVPQQFTADVLSIVCPTCGKVIYTFEQNKTYLEVYKQLLSIKNELKEHYGYCPTCGQHLDYEFDIIEA